MLPFISPIFTLLSPLASIWTCGESQCLWTCHFLNPEAVWPRYQHGSFTHLLWGLCSIVSSSKRPSRATLSHIAFPLARRDNKAFLSDQCKEIEENNRIGKTRDFFKKIRDTKGTFQAKVLEWVTVSFSRGSSQTRDWTQVSRIVGRCFTVWATREAEDIKKRWQEDIEELYKKDLHDPDNHDGVITQTSWNVKSSGP